MGTEPERPPAAEPAPAAFHYGPGHMIMHGNAVFVTMFGRGVVGQPAREAMIGLPAKAFELMDLVYTHGQARCLSRDDVRRREAPGRRPASRPGDRRDLRRDDPPAAGRGLSRG